MPFGVGVVGEQSSATAKKSHPPSTPDPFHSRLPIRSLPLTTPQARNATAQAAGLFNYAQAKQ